MNTLTSILLLLLLLIILSAIILGINFQYKSRENFRRLTWGLIIALSLQISVGLLFFTDVLANLPLAFFDILWWSTVLIGLVFGVMDFKKNSTMALIAIVLSIGLAIIGILSLLVGSM
ncbi:hypothetical protein [Planococcus salinarum]|uniref:hypothetical protein n=1 Tax=Planococcus salinarum TaxID=622695 RepID=UPI000E3D5030|nr:hypothetical protein [Planococcus salinarum]TAA72350.1 hypothetical protein D2909_07200 [Planococcus salinarum]